MALEPQDDFIVTVGGSDVTKDVESWEISDQEQSMSSISVTLTNHDGRHSGTGSMDEEISIRFGKGSLGPRARVKIKRMEASGSPHEHVKITGRDDQQKLHGGKNRGNFKKGMSPSGIEKSICQGKQCQYESGADGPKYQQVMGVYNETWRDIFYRTVMMKDPADGSDESPSSQIEADSGKPADFKGKDYDDGDLASSTGPQELKQEGGKRADKNRAKNKGNHAGSAQVHGDIQLHNFPGLQAKKTITIVGVPSRFAGTYYVEQARHAWRKGQGIRTSAKLTRGGTGKGGAGGKQPNVVHANIWGNGAIYSGPRKATGGAQLTLHWGQDEYFISYRFHLEAQSQRGAGEKGKGRGRGIDHRNKGQAFEAAASGGSSGGGGGSSITA